MAEINSTELLNAFSCAAFIRDVQPDDTCLDLQQASTAETSNESEDPSCAEEEEGPTLRVSATTISGKEAMAVVAVNAKVLRVKQLLAPHFDMLPEQLNLLNGVSALEDDVVLAEQVDSDEISLRVIVTMPKDVAQAVEGLADRKPGIRQRAAQQLGIMGERSKPALPYLEAALQDENDAVRCQAAWSLGMIGEHASSSVPALSAALEKERRPHCSSDSPRQFVVKLLFALSKIGKAGIPVLTNALNYSELRSTVVSAFGEAGESAADAVPVLVDAVKDSNKACRNKAVQSIVSIGAPVLPVLGELLEHSNDVVSETAAVALGRFGPHALPALERAMTSANPRVRRMAAGALGMTKETMSTVVLHRALDDVDWGVCVAAADALGQLGDVALHALERALCIDYWAMHDRLVEILEPLGRAAIPLLRRMIRECGEPTRIQAVDALGRVVAADEPCGPSCSGDVAEPQQDSIDEGCPSGVLSDLASLLKDTSPYVRESAASALGRMGPGAASTAPALAASLMHECHQEKVRQAAAQSLAKIGAAAIPSLEHVARSVVAPSYAGPAGRGCNTTYEVFAARCAARLAIVALGEVGRAALPALVSVMETPELHHLHLHAVDAFVKAAGLPPNGCTASSTGSQSNMQANRDAIPVATRVLPALARMLSDGDACLRWKVVDALADLRDVDIAPLVVPLLINALGDVSAGIRVAAAVALGKHGVAATPAFTALKVAEEKAAVLGGGQQDEEELRSACSDATAAIATSTARAAALVFRRRVLKTAAARWKDA